MKKSPIKVIVRIRPTSNFDPQLTMDYQTGQISIHVYRPISSGIVNHQQNQWGFQFYKILSNASQEVVYNLAGKDIMTSALDGYSGCVLCYGQTGAGKTFSMTGARSDYKFRGIVPRMLSSLYQEINTRYEHQIKVFISYLELYNETLVDLLNEDNAHQLSIQEDAKGYVMVKGLTKAPADNEYTALQLLFEGENNRTVAYHKLNRTSSRSHCIFTIHLYVRSKVESSEKVVMSKINLVDLAGSERTKKTGSYGKTLVEAQFINKSLSFLYQLVVALSDQQRDHIPYRQNKLTYLLKDSIGGNSKTCMIANIWPYASHLYETLSTLKFASRMMKVSNEISIYMNLDPKLLLKKYEKDIQYLKQYLAMHDTLSSRGRINYEPYTPEQQHKQQLIAQYFLDGKTDDIAIYSLRQVRYLFMQFRNIYRAAIRDVANNSQPKMEKEYQQKKGEAAEKKLGTTRVGQYYSNFGFGAGKAAKDARPTGNISNLVNIPRDEFEYYPPQVSVAVKRDPKIDHKIVNVDKNQAYQYFKSTAGQDLNNSILKNIEYLKLKKYSIRHKTDEVQKHKEQLELLSAQLRTKYDNKTQYYLAKNIIDEEEFELIKQKKLCKRDYKLEIYKIKAIRNDIVELDRNLTTLKTSMIQKFEQWFFKKYGISVSDLENPLLNQNEQYDELVDARITAKEDYNVDEDAVAYIQAKRKVNELQKARKNKL